MDRSDKSLPELMRELVRQFSSMMRHELGLARAEMAEKASQAGSGITMLGIALVLAIPAITILLMSAVLALDYVMEPWLAALIVGAVAALIAVILALKGRSNLAARNLTPDHTLHAMRDDAQFVRQQFVRERMERMERIR